MKHTDKKLNGTDIFAKTKVDFSNLKTFYGKYGSRLRKIMKNVASVKYELTRGGVLGYPVICIRLYLLEIYVDFYFAFSKSKIVLEFYVLDPDEEDEFEMLDGGQCNVGIYTNAIFRIKHPFTFRFDSNSYETSGRYFDIESDCKYTCSRFLDYFEKCVKDLCTFHSELKRKIESPEFNKTPYCDVECHVEIDRYELAERIKTYFEDCFHSDNK